MANDSEDLGRIGVASGRSQGTPSSGPEPSAGAGAGTGGREAPDGRKPVLRPREASLLDCLDDMVRQLFEVGLTLASCVQLVQQPATGRLNQAITQLDDMIRSLRAVAFKDARELATSRGLLDPQGEAPLDPVAGLELQTMLGVLDELEGGASFLVDWAVSQHADPTSLLDAVRGIKMAAAGLEAHSRQGQGQPDTSQPE